MDSERTLPIRVVPGAGESFTSYLIRVAHSLCVSLSALHARIGLAVGYSRSISYGILLTPQLVERLSHVTRLPKEQIVSMQLASFHGTAFDITGRDLTEAEDRRRFGFDHWVYLTGSHVCPYCLKDSDGAWQLDWKLPWKFACMRHESLLIDVCPQCRRRTSLERASTYALAPGLIDFEPTQCRHPAADYVEYPGDANSGQDKSMSRCGYALETASTLSLSHWPNLVRTQQRIEGILNGSAVHVFGEDVSAVSYFADLRSICSMFLSLGHPEDVEESPPLVRDTLVEHFEYRDEIRARQTRQRDSDNTAPKDTRLRSYSPTPQSAALMAGLVPKAVEFLDEASSDDLAVRLQPFVSRARAVRRRVHEVFAHFFFSPRLEKAFMNAWQPMRLRPILITGSYLRGRADTTLEDLSSDHVPQLLSGPDFEELFGELLLGFRKTHARRVCSMAVLKVTGRYTWQSAAKELGLPIRLNGKTMADRFVNKLSRAGRRELFFAKVREMAGRVAQNTNLTNYGFRRRLLADFVVMDADHWRTLCDTVSIHPGIGVRRYNASVWLWCYLTGGDYHFSPWFWQDDHENKRECYRQFVKKNLSQLQSPLVEYGMWLLRQSPGNLESNLR